ncbi:MAG: AtpZ/AtpI family protein [Saprospiraceae bacterium]|nr:AtpZ/AtpI family protein [Saprospiraceae bacterium]
MKYSGMAFELAAYLIVAVLIGGWLDDLLELEDPWMTILLLFLFLAGWFIRLYRDVSARD